MKLEKIIKELMLTRKHQGSSVGELNEKTRVDWIEQTLKKLPKGNTILDAGAGEQPYKKLCKHLNYISQDFAEYNPDNLNEGLQMEKWDYGKLDIISDITSIPVENNSFDAVLCTEVFEHIINPIGAINEFSRILRKNGYLIITAPFCSLTHFAPYHFYSGFNKYFYESELDKNGFNIIELIPNGNYFEYLAQEINRLSHMSQKYCDKRINKTEFDSIAQIKKLLHNLSKKDTGSSELLCFGYHILAQKK
ncbi:MAG: methyltransferase domain-containing protein [Flaviramulus sp.]|nr:methyltransferase domain-containing protein [Flaviramulus sp.]NNC50947.1 methyltransferase domain-containing protein [Flaviramulus sp.]